MNNTTKTTSRIEQLKTEIEDTNTKLNEVDFTIQELRKLQDRGSDVVKGNLTQAITLLKEEKDFLEQINSSDKRYLKQIKNTNRGRVYILGVKKQNGMV